MHTTTLLTIWAVIGPLVGVLIGGWLSMKNRRKLWVLDNRKAEFARLLTALTESASKFIRFYQPGVFAGAEEREVFELVRTSANLIYSSLFIAKEVQKLRVANRWQDAVKALRDNQNGIVFTNTFDALMNDIRSEAMKDFS